MAVSHPAADRVGAHAIWRRPCFQPRYGAMGFADAGGVGGVGGAGGAGERRPLDTFSSSETSSDSDHHSDGGRSADSASSSTPSSQFVLEAMRAAQAAVLASPRTKAPHDNYSAHYSDTTSHIDRTTQQYLAMVPEPMPEVGLDAVVLLVAASNELPGCKQDLWSMEGLWNSVAKRYGFGCIMIRTLDGSAGTPQATGAAIRAGLDWLKYWGSKANFVGFHFSGHGEQLDAKDDRGELEGKDECMLGQLANPEKDDPVPWDYVRDDRVRELREGLPAHVAMLATFDMCHSGGASDLDRAAVKLGNGKVRWKRNRKVLKARDDSAYAVAIAACRPNQTAVDLGKRKGGAFSFSLSERVKNPKPLTLASVLYTIQDGLDEDQNVFVTCSDAPKGRMKASTFTIMGELAFLPRRGGYKL